MIFWGDVSQPGMSGSRQNVPSHYHLYISFVFLQLKLKVCPCANSRLPGNIYFKIKVNRKANRKVFLLCFTGISQVMLSCSFPKACWHFGGLFNIDLFLFLLQHLKQQLPLAWPWTLCTASRMSYGVTSVRPLSPLSTVPFVTYIYVKPVWGNISKDPKITT